MLLNYQHLFPHFFFIPVFIQTLISWYFSHFYPPYKHDVCKLVFLLTELCSFTVFKVSEELNSDQTTQTHQLLHTEKQKLNIKESNTWREIHKAFKYEQKRFCVCELSFPSAAETFTHIHQLTSTWGVWPLLVMTSVPVNHMTVWIWFARRIMCNQICFSSSCVKMSNRTEEAKTTMMCFP